MNQPPHGSRRRVTSSDVARESGVSRATVSYVLNNVPGKAISPKTRALVLETAQRLGHVPHAAARSLRLGRSELVMLLMPGFRRGFVSDTVVHAIDIALAAEGYTLLVHHYSPTLRSLYELRSKVRPDLVVAMPGLHLPPGHTDGLSPFEFINVDGTVDHVLAGRMQAEYLLAKGHTRFGYAYPADPNLDYIAEQRYRGTLEACRTAGVPDPRLARFDTNRAEGSDQLLGWMSGSEPVTAICAHNDALALLLMSQAGLNGIRVPEDVAIMGIDNAPLAGIGITTIAMEVDAYSDYIARWVVNTLRGLPKPPQESTFLSLRERTSA